jgi:branched-chain amino acid transport system permease protein
VRATGQDRQVARLMGIDDRRIYNVAFALSAALMGIGAAVLVPFFYVHPAVGTSFLLKAFVIVVLGGLGSMPGAVVGGLLVGLIEGVVGLYVQAAAAQIVLFGLFVALVFVRPTGLLGVERQ